MAASIEASKGHDSAEVAITRVTIEIVAHPNDAALYLKRARLRLEQGQWKACLADLDRPGLAAPSDPEFMKLRGRALAAGRLWAEAKSVFGTHLKAHPRDTPIWIELAHVHDALGEKIEAAADYERAIRLMPHPEPDHYIECSDLLVQAGKADEALALLDRAPLLPVIAGRTITIELDLGRHDSALRRTDALLAVSRIQEPLLARRASILAQAGRRDESRLAWKTLIERINQLPPQVRSSQAMTDLIRQSKAAIEALDQTAITP